MIQKGDKQFDLSSFNELKNEMAVLKKQITNVREISKQPIVMQSDLAKDHNEESLQFEKEFQQMVSATFDLLHS